MRIFSTNLYQIISWGCNDKNRCWYVWKCSMKCLEAKACRTTCPNSYSCVGIIAQNKINNLVFGLFNNEDSHFCPGMIWTLIINWRSSTPNNKLLITEGTNVPIDWKIFVQVKPWYTKITDFWNCNKPLLWSKTLILYAFQTDITLIVAVIHTEEEIFQ